MKSVGLTSVPTNSSQIRLGKYRFNRCKETVLSRTSVHLRSGMCFIGKCIKDRVNIRIEKLSIGTFNELIYT